MLSALHRLASGGYENLRTGLAAQMLLRQPISKTLRRLLRLA